MNDALDWNNKWQYPLLYLYESEFARRQYGCLLYRVKKAMLGRPSKNLYLEELYSNIDKISDTTKRDAYKKACINVPEGTSMAIRNAVKTRANQMSGGVDSYDYQINDPYGVIDDDTEDLLAATCEQDYITNHLDRLAEGISRDLTEAGISAMLVKYDCARDRNRVLRINPKNIWTDTRYSATGEERFRAYSYMDRWDNVKRMIKEDGDEVNLNIEAPTKSIFSNGQVVEHAKVGRRKIRTLNGLDIYVEDINKLATATQLQGWTGVEFEEYMHDMRGCYNAGWYHNLANDPKARTNNGYAGNDVEVTVLYDLVNEIEFKILNRRYVISANSDVFHRKMVFTTYDPESGDRHYRIDDYNLPCPLKFVLEDTENRDLFPYPTSTLMTLLDSFDELCALRAKRKHVSDILSILRIETNGADAQSLRGLLNIMGIVLDDIQGDINTINLAYDYTPIDSQIEYYETLIKTTLDAYNEFDALQAMGDRASAAESGMALSAVAQGLATHQNAVMEMYAEIARQCIANRVAYSTKQEFPVYLHAETSSVTAEQMALTATISVKPKLAKKIQERLLSANALTLLGSIGDRLSSSGVSYLVSQAMMGTAPKSTIRGFVREGGASQEEIALAQQEAQNTAQMLAQNQRAYEQNPYPYEAQNVVENYSPEEVDEIVGAMVADQGLESLADLDAQRAEDAALPTEAAGFYNNENALIG